MMPKSNNKKVLGYVDRLIPSQIGKFTDLTLPEITGNEGVTQKQELLNKLCEQLIDREINNSEAINCARFLANLYSSKNGKVFRHRYSDISKLLLRSAESESGEFDTEPSEKAALLSQNMSKIAIEANREHPGMPSEETLNKILKLDDHIQLEYKRIAYITDQNKKQNSQLSDLDERLKRASNDLKEAAQKAEEARKAIDSSTKNSITILGIFAAIVLAFNGGVSFALASADKSSAIDGLTSFLIAMDLVGIVIFGTVFCLLDFLAKVAQPTIKIPKYTLIAVLGILLIIFIVLCLRRTGVFFS